MTPAPKNSQLHDRLDRSIRTLGRLYSNQARIAGLIAAQLQQCHTVATELGADFPWSSDKAVIYRSVAAEVGVANQVPDQTMEFQMMDAAALVEDFPNTLTSLLNGKIQAQHARAIQISGARITDSAIRADYERAVLEHVPTTVGKLRVIAKRLAERYAPQSIDERYAEAKKHCHVSVFQLDDGLAELVAVIPAVQAFAIKDRLDQYAYAANNAGLTASEITNKDKFAPARHSQNSPDGIIPESSAGANSPPLSPSEKAQLTRVQIAQLRAKFLADLLVAGTVACGDSCPPDCGYRTGNERVPGTGCAGISNIQGRVMVTLPALNLVSSEQADLVRNNKSLHQQAGLDGPAQLAGYGPIDNATALQIVGHSKSWLRLFVDPVQANVVQVDRYRPSQKQRSTLMARDLHCRFPGCTTAVFACDLDHTVDAALGGLTSNNNLEHLCRRHHTLKHQGNWNVNQRDSGNLEWTSPRGYKYHEPPPSTGLFEPPLESSQQPLLSPASTHTNFGANLQAQWQELITQQREQSAAATAHAFDSDWDLEDNRETISNSVMPSPRRKATATAAAAAAATDYPADPPF